MAARRGGLLFAPQKKRHPGRFLAVLLFVFIVGIVLGLNAINNGHLSLLKEKIGIAGMTAKYEGFSVLHISDLHGHYFGDKQEGLYQQIRLERYHAVCLTGDMTGKEGNAQALLDLLERIPSDVPVFLIAGDEDPQPLNSSVLEDDVKADYILQAEKMGAIYLDSPQKVVYQGQNVWFVPASLYMTDLQSASYALSERKEELEAMASADFSSPQDEAALRVVNYQLQVLAQTEFSKQEMKQGDVYILLSHFPLNSEDIAGMHKGERLERFAINFPGRVSLVLAGHWNNGQWRLPVMGPVYMPKEMGDWMPAEREMSGLATLHGVPQYVSPGLGSSVVYPAWMPMRLFNRPQMTLIELSNKLI